LVIFSLVELTTQFDLPSRPGVTAPVYVTAAPTPRESVILFPVGMIDATVFVINVGEATEDQQGVVRVGCYLADRTLLHVLPDSIGL
jgi:hypothetical protein